jgi:electron transport complex protein RnfC
MMGKLWRFSGGIHPPGNKHLSRDKAIAQSTLPERLYLPLSQHIGEPAKPIVAVGDKVAKGQPVAAASGPVSAPIHASTSGTVVAIEDHPIPHPSGLAAPCLIIESDGEDRWFEELEPVADFTTIPANEIRERVRLAGIVGLGGAAFPTSIKLNPGQGKEVDELVLNGAECEPYITSDERMMLERADEIIAGARVMRHAIQAKRCIIGIEDNKPEAFATMRDAAANCDDDIQVVQVPTVYPTGGEKQLIRVLTGKQVPSRGLPINVGVVCHNIGTAFAVKRAVIDGQPLISRVVTVTGHGVKSPRNVEARIGTPIAHLVQQAEGYAEGFKRLIMGGPMMGFALHDDTPPMVKATNCVLAVGKGDPASDYPTMPCIRCGQCTGVCPMHLLPQQMYWYSRAKDFDRVQDYNLFDCIECGCCTYVCPAHIPLVQYFRFSKNEIYAQEREKQTSERARLRHEARQQRLEREKLERAERAKKMKEAMAAKKASDAKKKAAAVAAAPTVAEAPAAPEPRRKAAANITPHRYERMSPEQRQKIESLDARRARIRSALEEALGVENRDEKRRKTIHNALDDVLSEKSDES